jgi:Cdc6-like AAA superfamily ATPase
VARSDLLLALIRAGATGDETQFRRAADAVIADERSKKHDVLAERLATVLRQGVLRSTETHAKSQLNGHAVAPGQTGKDLVTERTPQRDLSSLILSPALRDALNELVEEQRRSDILRSHSIEPRHRVLLTGPPGNGKTSIAEAIAYELAIPLLSVRYDALIGSYLGETASRLRRLFEYTRTRSCVLFFDEFDTLGKERGDTHDTGEVKRVVSSLLLQIDDLPSYVVIVTATNHPELLDRAVWRRFQLRLSVDQPSHSEIKELATMWREQLKTEFGYSEKYLADKLVGGNFAEIEEFFLNLARRQVLRGPDADPRLVARASLDQWKSRVQPTSPSVRTKRK